MTEVSRCDCRHEVLVRIGPLVGTLELRPFRAKHTVKPTVQFCGQPPEVGVGQMRGKRTGVDATFCYEAVDDPLDLGR